MKKLEFPLLILLFTTVFLHFGFMKEGFFIDEVYTYGLSNSHYAPFISDVKDLSNGWALYEKDDFRNYLEVTDNRFDFRSVYYNQTHDVHPPMYYWLINIVSSLFPGSHSKWLGLGLNLLLSLLTIILLFFLSNQLFHRPTSSIIVCGLYAFSQIGMSTALLIRMYALLTPLTLLLAILVIRLMDCHYKWYDYAALMLTIFAGLMTQYYFVFYAFFISLSFLVWCIKKTRIKQLCFFSASSITGVLLMILAYPAVLSHLGGGGLVSGNNALENILDFKHWLQQGFLYSFYLFKGLHFAVILLIGFLSALVINKKWSSFQDSITPQMVIVFFPAVIAFLVIIIVSPIAAVRYLYSIIPVLLLIIPFVLSFLSASSKTSIFDVAGYVGVAITVIASLCIGYFQPNYIYPDKSDIRTAILGKYQHCPCVFITKEVNPCMTEAMPELELYDNVFLSKNGLCDEARAYILESNARDLILYVGTNRFWFEPTDTNLILQRLLDTGIWGLPERFPNLVSDLSDVFVLHRLQ